MATLVEVTDGRPISRRVESAPVGAWSDEEAGGYRYGVTAGTVGAEADVWASAVVIVETGSSWTLVAGDAELIPVSSRAEPGVRQWQVLNATGDRLDVAMNGAEPFALAPGEISDWSRLGRESGVLTVDIGEGQSLEFTTPEPGPSVAWTAVLVPGPETLQELGVLLPVESNAIYGDLELVTSTSP